MQKICFDLEIYSYLIDFLGHVNNTVYMQWMEIGRTKLLEAIGLPTDKIFQQSKDCLLTSKQCVQDDFLLSVLLAGRDSIRSYFLRKMCLDRTMSLGTKCLTCILTQIT